MARRTKFQGSAPLMEKKSFIKIGEGAIASYDWKDFLQGFGSVAFYGFRTNTGFNLTNTTIFGDIVFIEGHEMVPGENTDWVELWKETFEVDVSLPLIMQGTMSANVPFMELAETTDVTKQTRVKITLYKNDTKIVEGYSRTLSNSSSPTEEQQRIRVVLMEVPTTTLGVGDKLKVEVEAMGRKSSGLDTNIRGAVALCPMNRDVTDEGFQNKVTFVNSQMVFNIPFKIDI